ncbi:glycoside hydrolase family 16 protein [Jatrophihabitans sp.]|uniref:glycoside hydrolase family 16 protein n=1 Tax=Jatrophihabitans sp. TaxID=1932789 RepID=UPI0030C6ECE5
MLARRRPILIVILAVLVLAGVLVVVSRPGTTSTCGTISAPGGGRWHCTFDDEFDGSTLDPAHWQVVKTTQYGFHSGAECYVDDGQHVGVGRGVLTLTVTHSAEPVGCGGISTQYASGMVTSSGHFAQLYGRFEIRAKLPAEAGLQPALWMYPQAQTYGRWPTSGEIDIAELFGSSPGSVAAHLHYRGRDGLPTSQGGSCSVSDPAGEFHTYGVDWTPTSIAFEVDGRQCADFTNWQPNQPLSQPAPFDHPFYILLELALGNTSPNLPSAATALPASMEVDYVRAWGSSTAQ